MSNATISSVSFTDVDLLERVSFEEACDGSQQTTQPPQNTEATEATKVKIPKFTQEDFEFPGGDISVQLTDENGTLMKGKVCSQSMSLACPTIKNLVFPQTQKENEPAEPAAELDFSKDDAASLLILLNIIHLKFRSVPRRELTYPKLLAMARICEKYSCVSLVEVFLPDWLDGEEYESDQDNRENWLYIAYVFGRKEIFLSLAGRLVKEVTVSDGKLLTRTSKKFVGPMPEKIIESIKNTREATIRELLELWYSYAHSFLGRDEKQCKEGNGRECNSMAYGAVGYALTIQGLWPQKDASEIQMSVDELVSKLSSMKIYIIDKKHRKCLKTDIHEKMKSFLKDIESPVLNVHEQHLDTTLALLEGDTESEPDYEHVSDFDRGDF